MGGGCLCAQNVLCKVRSWQVCRQWRGTWEGAHELCFLPFLSQAMDPLIWFQRRSLGTIWHMSETSSTVSWALAPWSHWWWLCPQFFFLMVSPASLVISPVKLSAHVCLLERAKVPGSACSFHLYVQGWWPHHVWSINMLFPNQHVWMMDAFFVLAWRLCGQGLLLAPVFLLFWTYYFSSQVWEQWDHWLNIRIKDGLSRKRLIGCQPGSWWISLALSLWAWAWWGGNVPLISLLFVVLLWKCPSHLCLRSSPC